jgi:hypothetical protein
LRGGRLRLKCSCGSSIGLSISRLNNLKSVGLWAFEMLSSRLSNTGKVVR